MSLHENMHFAINQSIHQSICMYVCMYVCMYLPIRKQLQSSTWNTKQNARVCANRDLSNSSLIKIRVLGTAQILKK